MSIEYSYEALLKINFNKFFNELSTVVSRFSEFKEDLAKYPGVYVSEPELQQKILEVKKILVEH